MFRLAGLNMDKDFASIGDDKTTSEKWWPVTDGCQERIPGASPASNNDPRGILFLKKRFPPSDSFKSTSFNPCCIIWYYHKFCDKKINESFIKTNSSCL